MNGQPGGFDASGGAPDKMSPRAEVEPTRLDREQLLELAELVADLVVERLGVPAPEGALVDAATLARLLGVDRSFVYRRADELGAVRLGDGPRARPRFDVDEARRRLAACQGDRTSGSQEAAAGAVSRHRRRRGSGTSVELLPVRGGRDG
jgi:hypothetical protein